MRWFFVLEAITQLTMAEKFTALTFQSIEDFETCNKFIGAELNDMGLHTNNSADFTNGESLENSCFLMVNYAL